MSTARFQQRNGASYPNRCLAPGCTRPRYAYGLCKPHHERLERRGDPAPAEPIGSAMYRLNRTEPRRDRAMHGPFVCLCAVSRPKPWEGCQSCGYPYWPNPPQWAIDRYPALATQQVER